MDDNPIALTLTDFVLVPSESRGYPVAVAGGYRNDSAFAVILDVVTEEQHLVFLNTGVDHSGNGAWEPTVAWCATIDYDFDGRQEVFIQVNAGRDLRPRELFCLEIESNRIEWSLPVAPLVAVNGIYPCGDSAEPAVIFVSYNPKQGVSDSAFSDRFGYLSVVNSHGELIFNRIIAVEHGGMFILPADEPGQFYLAHTVPLTDPADTLALPDQVDRISKITCYGEILASTTIPIHIKRAWLASAVGGPEEGLFTIGRDGVIRHYDSNLNLRRQSEPVPLSDFYGTLTLSPDAPPALVFSSTFGMALYTPDFEQIGCSTIRGRFVQPLEYDRHGRLKTLLVSGKNVGAILSLQSRSLVDYLHAAAVRYYLYLLLVVVALLTGVILINHRRLRTMQRLRKQEIDLGAFIAASPDLVFRFGREGKIIDYQTSDSSLLAMPPEQFLGRSLRDILPSSITDLALRAHERVLSTGILQTFEYEIELQGELHYFEARVAPIGDNEVISVNRDITDRKRAELDLRESEERMRTLIDNIPGAVFRFTLNDNWSVEFVSDVVLAISGYPAEDFVGDRVRSWHSIVHPDDRKTGEQCIRQAVDRRTPYEVEYRIIHATGEIRWVFEKAQVVFDADGVPRFIDGVFIDITAQRTAELARRTSDEQMRAQFKNFPIPTYTWQRVDDDFVLIEYNDAALVPTAGKIKDLVGIKCRDLYRDVPAIPDAVIECFAKQVTINREMDYTFQSTGLSVSLSVRYVFVAPDLVMVHVEDITEPRRSRELLAIRLRYEEALAACSQTLLAAPSADGDVLNRALKYLLEATDVCRVYLFENFTSSDKGLCMRQTHEVCRGGVRPMLSAERLQPLPYEPDFATMKEHFLRDEAFGGLVREMDKAAREEFSRQDTKSIIMLPLYIDGEWAGSIGFDDTRSERVWEQEDVRLLRTAAAMIGSYLDMVSVNRQLTRERDFTQSILRTTNSLVLCLDERGRITVFNDELERLTGYTREEMLGTPWVERFVPERYLHDGLKDFGKWVREHPSDQYERELILRNGEERLILWSNSMMINPHTGELTAIAIGQDVTDRELARAAERENAAKYRAVMEQSADNIYLADVETRKIIEANVALQKLLGYSDEEMKNLTVYDFIEHDNSDIDDRISEVVSENLTFLPLRYYRRRDGRLVPVEVMVNPVQYNDRNVLCIVSRDITERLKAEQALREQEEKYRLLVENVNASVSVVAYDGTFSFVNQSVGNDLSDDPVNIVGRSMYDYFPQPGVEHQMTAIRGVIDSGKPLANEFKVHWHDSWRWFFVMAQPYKDAYGQTTAALVIAHDITATKVAQEALNQSEERFREMADMLPQTIFESDARGRVTYANRQGILTFGYEPDDLTTGLNVLDLFVPEDREAIMMNFEHRLRGEQPTGNEYTAHRKDATTFPVLIYSTAIRRENQVAGLRGIVIDITERKEAEEQVRRANQARYQQLREVAGGVSHEIYNSLYPAVTGLDKIRQLLAAVDPADPERTNRLIKMSEAAVQRAIGLTETVSKFSRLESEKGNERIYLAELFDEVLEANDQRIAELRVSVRCDFDNDLTLICGKSHAYAVFNNLVINALDALAEVDDRNLTIEARRDNGRLVITVSDSGSGIPPEVRDRIFDAFVSAKPNKGTGLGLAIVKQIIELYGGEIKVTSDLDNGTRFTIFV